MSQRFYLPREQVFTNLGAIGAGWKLYTYETGTTTPKATYSNTALSSANPNPTIADSSGRFGDIFVNDLSTYKAILKDDLDNTIWTSDPVDPKTFTLADFDPAPVSFWGTTTGTSTAYELIADPTQTAYSSNSVFYIKFHTACGASPTLTVDSLATLNLKKRDGAGTKVALEVNDVLPNYKYACENDGTDIVVLNPEINQYIKTNKFKTNKNTATISSGSITYSGAYMVIDGEGAAADTLTTINGGNEGDIIIIGIADAANDITIDSGADNIVCLNGYDVVLGDIDSRITFEYDGTNWVELNRSVNGGYAIFEDQKSSGTAGGSPTTGARNTRTLNTTVLNTIFGCSLGSNQITLPAGTYYINAKSIAGAVNGHKLFFRNTTDSTDDIIGTSAYSSISAGTSYASIAEKVITIASQKVFQLEHYIAANGSGASGLGYPAGSGSVEVYSHVLIQKIV